MVVAAAGDSTRSGSYHGAASSNHAELPLHEARRSAKHPVDEQT